MRANEFINEADFYGGDNSFADELGNKFNVQAVNDFVAKNKSKYLKRNFPISKIEHNRKYWQKDKTRMMNTDTRHPLLVLKEPDGNLSVADGLNRLEKAIRVEKKTAVDVYFVPKADIMHLAQPSEGIAEGPHDPYQYKAIFFAGSPGSGKTYVARKLAGTFQGLKQVNMDSIFKHLMTRKNLSWKMPPEEEPEREKQRQR